MNVTKRSLNSDESSTPEVDSQNSEQSKGESKPFERVTKAIIEKIVNEVLPYTKDKMRTKFLETLEQRVKPFIEKQLKREYENGKERLVNEVMQSIRQKENSFLKENERLNAEIKKLKARNERLDKQNKEWEDRFDSCLYNLCEKSWELREKSEALRSMVMEKPIYPDFLRALLHFADYRETSSKAFSKVLPLQHEIICMKRGSLNISKMKDAKEEGDVLSELEDIRQWADQIMIQESADPELIETQKSYKKGIDNSLSVVRKQRFCQQVAALYIALSEKGILASFDSKDLTLDAKWCVDIGERIRACMTDCGFELLHPDKACGSEEQYDFVESSYDCSGLYVRDDRKGLKCICEGYAIQR